MLPVRPAPNPASTRKRNSRTLTPAVRPPSAPARSCPHRPGASHSAPGDLRRAPARVWCDRPMAEPDDDRREPDADGDEREILIGWLEFHRATLARKCAGLSEEQLRSRPIPPSTLSLIGLVRHLTEIERLYIRHGFAGEQISPLQYVSDEEPDGDFDVLDDVAGSLAAWQEHVAA